MRGQATLISVYHPAVPNSPPSHYSLMPLRVWTNTEDRDVCVGGGTRRLKWHLLLIALMQIFIIKTVNAYQSLPCVYTTLNKFSDANKCNKFA